MSGRRKLFAWVKHQHEGQLIRNTKAPYIRHLKAVAQMADMVPLGYEVALCHDLLEKTTVTEDTLRQALLKFGYDDLQASIIVVGVVELTNVFTKNAYPQWRKSFRKNKEAERLSTISPLAQTVKYADLIYNINWMLTYDLKHLKKYLLKKELLLKSMCKGDLSLRFRVMKNIKLALNP